MQFLRSLLTITFLLVLTACNGSSGENDTGTTEPLVASSLTLSIFNSTGSAQQSFDKNEVITLNATVLDQTGAAMNGVRVNFDADLGILSVSSALTNNAGIASVTISNPNSDLSAGTAGATVGSLTSSVDYEYTNNEQPAFNNKLIITLEQGNTSVNRFSNNESVQVVALLTTSDGTAINDQIIDFSADVGQLSAAKGLTTNGKASVTLSGNDELGAGVLTASYNNEVVATMNYEIVSPGSSTDNELLIGHFNSDNDFIQGEIGVTTDTISAGGTLGLNVSIVNSQMQPVANPITVSFTSNCVINELASLDQTSLTIQGKATATFEDLGCAGTSGTTDSIVASITNNSVESVATKTINITGEDLGSIEFLSAQPENIVIQGSGGQESSTITFKVNSSLGNPIAQQEVSFTLDTDVGGIALSRTSGFTNSQGVITTQVLAGTVPTVVRVTATASLTTNGNTNTVQTQSNQLSVNTGLPDQSSMTISATVLNPEASLIGAESQITAWLADSFNNPVPDGTTVNFTTEGGTIDSSCLTTNGRCSVTWRSTNELPNDHRSTILITASGHETFFDTNGNNIFDDADGSAVTNASVSSGFGRQSPLSSGFVDMSEAWRDDDEDGVKDSSEVIFFDDNGDGAFNGPDGKFNGPQCDGSKCDSNAKKATLRKALVLIMSHVPNPKFILSNQSGTITYADQSNTNIASLPSVSDGGSQSFTFSFADSAEQILPFGSTVSISTEGGELKGQTDITIGNSNRDTGYDSMSFTVVNALGGDPEVAVLTFSIKGPRGESTETSFTRSITLN